MKVSTSIMEPLMPQEGQHHLSDLVIDLVAKAEGLKGKLNNNVQKSLGDMLRNMNCYYSNFIEGHNTHPYDIERALKKDFSKNIEQRNLQLEAKAHINLQKKIDDDDTLENITSADYLLWLHREFCSALPEELLWIENPETHESKKVIPGTFRDGNVKVGYHIPIDYQDIERFLKRFDEAYNVNRHKRIERVIAASASHHRLLWIHPFYDGNGRVARLFSHAYLKKIGLGTSLWSISRGLARKHHEYKKLLMQADMERQGNYDGRGALTQTGLIDFCTFFIECCIDQIEFMEKLLQPDILLQRIERWTTSQIEMGNLPKGSFFLLQEALIHGEFERGKAATLTQYKERQARTILNALAEKGLLISDTPKGPVRLAFPAFILEDWFPKLFMDKI